MGLKLPTWEELSKDEQVPIINLPLSGKYIIEGGPGTGKTILALYRASRWRKVSEGNNFEILFLVYNKTLKQYLSEAVKKIELENSATNTYHSWFYKLYYSKTNQNVPQVKNYCPDWPEVEKRLSNELNNYNIEYLLLDEAQDFPVELLRILNSISSNATIFCDTKQAIHEKTTTVDITSAFEAGRRVFYLTKNYRNTVEISEAANIFYQGDLNDIPAKPRKTGPKPRLLKCENMNEATDIIANFADNNIAMSVGVITPGHKIAKKYFDTIKSKCTAKVQIYISGKSVGRDEFSFEDDGVKIVTYKTAKGLEFDAVFLPEIDDDYFINEDEIKNKEIYVASTRAKNDLTYTYSSNTNSFVINKLMEHPELIDIAETGNSSDIIF